MMREETLHPLLCERSHIRTPREKGKGGEWLRWRWWSRVSCLSDLSIEKLCENIAAYKVNVVPLKNSSSFLVYAGMFDVYIPLLFTWFIPPGYTGSGSLGRFTSIMELIFEDIDKVDASMLEPVDDQEVPQCLLIPASRLAELDRESSKLKTMGTLTQVYLTI